MSRTIRLKPSPATHGPGDPDDNVSFAEELVEIFLADYTQPGDLVFDPFAGFGTTLIVAERLGRRALGLELMPDRVALVRERLSHPDAILQGDAIKLAEIPLPAVDFVMTSPPYMSESGHPQNPLTAYTSLDGDYARYLRELTSVFAAVAALLKPGGHAVVNVADIRSGKRITHLASDLKRELAGVMNLVEEVRVEGSATDPTIEADYCLVFQAGA